MIFPERRSGPRVPCLFLLPPFSFPELERQRPRLGIRDIVSISPSLATDALLRESFQFPLTNELATILIGCNGARLRGGPMDRLKRCPLLRYLVPQP